MVATYNKYKGIDAAGKPEKMLTEMGVAVRDSEGQFRDFGAVMDDLNKKWGSLSQTEKIATAQQVAGIQRYNQFMSMMNNYQMSLDATTTALNSQGSATKENEIYMQSAQARLNILKTTMQEFALNSINSDFMKGIINGLTKFIEIMGNAPGVITTVTLALMLFKGEAIAGAITGLTTFISTLITATGTANIFKIAMGELDIAMSLNPIGLIAVALTALVGTMVVLNESIKKSTDYAGKLNEATKALEQTKSVDTLIQKYKDLEIAIKSAYEAGNIDLAKTKEEELLSTQKKLAELYPELTTGYTNDGIAIIDNIEKVNSYINGVNLDKWKDIRENYDSLMKSLTEEHKISPTDAGKTVTRFDWDTKSFMSHNKSDEIPSLIDQYQKLISKQGQLSAYESKTKDEIKAKIISERDAVLKLASAGEDVSGMKIFDFTKNAFVEATDYVNKNTDALKKNKEALDAKIKKEKEELSKKYDVGDSSKNYSDALSKQQKIVELQKQMNDENKLTPAIMQSALELYPEMGSAVFDMTTLQGYLNNKIAEQESIQKKAYINMMQNDDSFFSTKIKNTSDWEKFEGTVLTNLEKLKIEGFTNDVEGMKTGLDNAKNVAQARFAIESKLIEAQAKMWAEYYGKLAMTKEKATDGSTLYEAMYDSHGQVIKGQGYEDIIAKQQEQQKAIQAMKDASANLGSGIELATPKFSASDFDKSDSKTKKEIQNLESLVDRYLNLNQALNTVNATLSAYEIAMKNAHGQENISYIQKEIEAYKQKQSAISNNIAELKREKSELASAISSKGFNIDGMDRITNYSAQLTALTNQANSMASGTDAQEKAREKAKSDVQAISEKIKRFSEITSQEIPKMDDEWQSLVNTIQDTYKTMQKLVVDAESKITEVIKDELTRRTNAKIDALDKEKKLLDDKNKSDDYADTLQTAQTKVTDFDSKIMEAIKSRDKESIKSLTKAKQDAMDELNKTIQDHERESVSNKFDDEKQKLQDNLTDLTKPENMTKLISESMANGFINVNGEVIKLSDAMDNFLKNSVSGVQSLKSEMSDLVNIMNDGISAFNNAGMLSNVKNSTLSNLAFGGNVLNNFNTTVPNISNSNKSASFVLNTPLVHIERADSSNLDEIGNIVEGKLNNFVREFNNSQYVL